MPSLESFFGTVALITSLIGLFPQSYKAMKTRSTMDISMLMLLNFLCCSVAWVIYGFCIQSHIVIFSNIIGTVACLLLTLQKYYYDHRP